MPDGLPSMYIQGLSLTDISLATGIPVSTVRYRLMRDGVELRSRTEALRQAMSAGKFANRRGMHRKPVSASTRAALRDARNAWAATNARGVTRRGNGYEEYTRGPHKGRSVHVVAVETAIGRRLHPNEVVHHRDHDRTNNDISNLVLMTRSAHAALHAAEYAGLRNRNTLGQFSSGRIESWQTA